MFLYVFSQTYHENRRAPYTTIAQNYNHASPPMICLQNYHTKINRQIYAGKNLQKFLFKLSSAYILTLYMLSILHIENLIEIHLFLPS